MASTLPPDPYAALGVPKDATAGAIKTAYRKLALTCHPDKVTGDEALKRQKADEFCKIQEAYDTIGDEDKRATYDAEVRLEFLRKEKQARGGVDVKTARYDVRTAAPAGASFQATGAHRYEERKPSRSYEDDRSSSRKYDTYDASPKSYSRSSRKEEPVRVKVSSDRTRSDRDKKSDRDRRSDRSGKFVVIDDESSSNDERARWEAGYGRRSDEDRRRKEEDDAQKAFADARRKADVDRRSYDDRKEPRRNRSGDEVDRTRKTAEMENDAVRYIHRSRVEADPRPSPSRTTSSRDVPREYERSSRRPEPVRRSSARPSKERPSSGRDAPRDRKGGIPEIVEWEDDRKAPPSFKHSSSSPADIHVPQRATPQRSQTQTTESSRDQRRSDTSPTPLFRRADTMPSGHATSSSRRKESRPTPLRASESASTRDGEAAFRTVPAPQPASSSTKYYYPTPAGGVSLRPEDVGVANGHRTILREPERQRHRSPSPLSRPPIGPNRPSEDRRAASSTIPPPPLGRSQTFASPSPVREERGRSNMLYGERESDFTRRSKARQTSFSPDSVSYTKNIGPEDIRWSRGRDPAREEREYVTKPTLGRHPTYVY